jgi:hypothetical protein
MVASMISTIVAAEEYKMTCLCLSLKRVGTTRSRCGQSATKHQNEVCAVLCLWRPDHPGWMGAKMEMKGLFREWLMIDGHGNIFDKYSAMYL